MTRLLILGGTAFIGRAIAAEAIAQGFEVTTFNRGHTGEDVSGVTAIRGDRYAPKDVVRLTQSGSWDAVIDTSGYVPRNVLSVTRTLAPLTSRYLFMSSVSVYADWPIKPLTTESSLLECPPDADENYGVDVEDGPTRYGYQKSGCEMAVRISLGDERTTVLRPGVVLGPHEYVGRLPWWLRRIAQGGRTLAPGKPERTIQPVDVRDVALFALRCITEGTSGAFNVTAPVDGETFGGFLNFCAKATEAEPEFVWVPDDILLRSGVRQWSELPLWRTFPGVWQVDSSSALAHGLTCRPLSRTIQDTWEWLLNSPMAQINVRSSEIGLDLSREQAILAALTR
ncbi:NAD-dependent epimerase/dehydratase family protein [Sphaerisporangium album]|uniref:NAD-dependent epimerase/dehydratase family protein n=1 Tax=Sphaerisporangium album TaxID=509200 RepID=A0A367FRI7_9ACTN|nr:NAD-dependent epimerase/dehydratase family protein [Sphaerisporangium album]RCG32988.1 NAD-dependent epimerase/dehydratase family protein [Sphaerisporangium album]